MSIWHHIYRFHAAIAVLLVSLICIAWIWLLVDKDGATHPARSAASAATEVLQEPITAIPRPIQADPRKLALGEALFRDPRLLGYGQIACITCHDIGSNGASRNRFDPSDSAPVHANTPTVFNAALNFRLNWAGNERSLEDQVVRALRIHGSVADSPDQTAGRLNQAPDIAARFQQAYGHPADRQSLLDAIAIYERSLLTPGSRFDRWLAGDRSALSAEELQGYRDFKTLGCIACHQGANVGGNLFEQSGVFHPLTDSGSILLRVPSLRNVATTAPYFHDGSAATLSDAVRRMASAQLNQTLTEEQDRDIVAFLGTLTGRYDGTPVRAPSP
jgi:cytochrome c peroxidase